MSSRLRDNEPFLRLVASKSTSPKQRREIVRTASKEQVNTVCECAYNLLKQNVPVTPNQLEGLKRYKKLLYILVDRGVPVERKRRRLQQSGGLLPALLAPIVGSIIGGLVDRYVVR